jgi:GNAT superfamily N-acetyltransferase
VVTGFASPDAQGVPSHESYPRDLLESVMADMASADGFSRYLARRDGVAAGGASLRLFDGVAHLCGAATLPEHRRNGVQSALLATRLEAARRAGCDVAVVTTQPGSKSQENVQRQGFELLYTRAVLVRSA